MHTEQRKNATRPPHLPALPQSIKHACARYVRWKRTAFPAVPFPLPPTPPFPPIHAPRGGRQKGQILHPPPESRYGSTGVTPSGATEPTAQAASAAVAAAESTAAPAATAATVGALISRQSPAPRRPRGQGEEVPVLALSPVVVDRRARRVASVPSPPHPPTGASSAGRRHGDRHSRKYRRPQACSPRRARRSGVACGWRRRAQHPRLH